MKRIVLITAACATLLVPALAFGIDGDLAAQGAYESKEFAGGIFVESICDLYSLVGGTFGALLTSAALMTGLIAAAVGGFQEVRTAVMAGVASFAIASGVSIYFGRFDCAAKGGGGGAAQAQPAGAGVFDDDL